MYALVLVWVLNPGGDRIGPVAIFPSKADCQRQVTPAINYKAGQLAALGYPDAGDTIKAFCTQAFYDYK